MKAVAVQAYGSPDGLAVIDVPAHAHFVPGESVLVRGAAGSLGIMTVQLAARGGAGAIACR